MILPSTSCAQVSLPAFTRFSVPSPAPPPPGETFTLPSSLTLTTNPTNPNAPVCAEWTRTAGPDESLLITGVNFSAFHDDHLGQDARFRLADGSGQFLTQPHIQRLQADKVILTLPKDLAPWTMYLLWPANQTGYGQPIALNQTEAWWVGPDQAAPASTVSVFGRNLSYRNDTLQSYVYLLPKLASQGSGQWVATSRVNPYRVSVDLPPDLPLGDYEVWTHNGHGGAYGWSGPLALSVQAAVQWSAVRFDVKAYGATGNGQTDDTGAIQRALTAARQSPYSTIYFPAGVYLINDMLLPSNQTRWLGQGKGQSVLRCGAGFSPQAFCLLYGQVSHLELAEMAFEGDHHYKGNYQGNQTTPIDLRGSRGVRLTNVRFSFQDYDILQLDNTNQVFINGCELIGKISFLGKSSQLFIDRCRFWLTNDAELALHSWGGTGISLTNSTCQDLNNADPTSGAGWGKGRFFVGTGNWGSNRFTYIAHNTTNDLAPRPQGGVDQNSGEQFLWEGNQTDWVGSPSASTERTTKLAGFSASYEFPHDAVIIKGRGLGQSRRITAYNNSTITVETPWTVVPDQSSVLVVGRFVDRVVVYGNAIDGKAQAVASPTHVASTGIQPYGGTANFIADGNLLNEVRSGLANWATQEAVGVGLCPNYFNLYVNNRVTNCRWGIHNGVDVERADGTAMLGTVYRRNLVSGAVGAGITNVLYPSSYSLMDGLVYEHNAFVNVVTGYATEKHFAGSYDYSAQPGSIANQVLYNNGFRSSSATTGGALAITPNIALRANAFQGFSSIYKGSARPVLEAPQRVVELSGGAKGEIAEVSLMLWNSGTSLLSWQASSNVSWLRVVNNRGIINGQYDSSNVVLRASPQGLTIGEHTATINVRVGNQVKYYIVHFTVLDAVMPILNVYMNPFYEKTIVEFQSPQDEEAMLQIFNVQGGLVETLFKGTIKAKQIYNYEFNGNQQKSGMYICRLICGKTVLMQKLLLLK